MNANERPSPTADPTRLADLKAIHAAARRRGLDTAGDRTAYEGLLYDITGQTSARDLDADQRAAVLRRLGVDPARAPAWRPSPKPAQVSDAQWKYIGDLCVKLQMDEQTFARRVRHITGLDTWAWLDTPTARALLAGLLHIQAAKPKTRVPARGNPRRRW